MTLSRSNERKPISLEKSRLILYQCFSFSLTRNARHLNLPDYTCAHFFLFAQFCKSFCDVAKDCPFVLSIITGYLSGTGAFD